MDYRDIMCILYKRALAKAFMIPENFLIVLKEYSSNNYHVTGKQSIASPYACFFSPTPTRVVKVVNIDNDLTMLLPVSRLKGMFGMDPSDIQYKKGNHNSSMVFNGKNYNVGYFGYAE